MGNTVGNTRMGRTGAFGMGSLVIRVVLPNDRPLDDVQVRVQLIGSAGVPIAEKFTMGKPEVEFGQLAPGSYSVQVSGPQVEDTRSEMFQVMEGIHNEDVRVKLREKEGSATSTQGTVSAYSLKVPPKAAKELEKGREKVRQNQWEQAETHFRKAIEIYPDFAAAHNILGLVCAHQKNFFCAREAWEKAVELDPGTADGFINLGRLRLMEHEYSQAEALLLKGVTLDPRNPDGPLFLANAELMLQKFSLALTHARQALALSPASPAVAHLIAGGALEAQKLPEEAAAEYEKALKVSPGSPAGEKAKQALARIRQPMAADQK